VLEVLGSMRGEPGAGAAAEADPGADHGPADDWPELDAEPEDWA
jgi:ATP-dependent DNA helicase RecQ